MGTKKSTDWGFIGRNVRWLRRRAGLSQVQLAATAGINQGALSRIETGENTPSGPVIYALSKALFAPADAILASDIPDRQEILRVGGQLPFRVTLDSSTVAPEIERTTEELVAAVLALEDICGAQKVPRISLNMLYGHSEEAVSQTVDALRAYMQVRSGVLFDYFELLEVYGLRVLVVPLPKDLDGFSYYDPPHRNAFLFVNANMNPERQLFRLCYEFGHVCLFASPTSQYASHTPPPPQSATPIHHPQPLDTTHAARKFAALFLLPADAVRATVLQLGIREQRWSYDLLLRIKHRFGVSAEMFLYRLEELDLIAPALVTELKARIYEHYEATDYAEPDSTRRILTPNGRLWDLVLTAQGMPGHAEEVEEIVTMIASKGVTGR